MTLLFLAYGEIRHHERECVIEHVSSSYKMQEGNGMHERVKQVQGITFRLWDFQLGPVS